MARIAAGLTVLGFAWGSPDWASVTVSDTDTLRLQPGEQVIEAKLQEGGLVGPGIRIERQGAALGGHVERERVWLRWNNASISGLVGDEPIDLQVLPSGQADTVIGSVGGDRAELTVQPTSIRGQIGACRYELELAGDEYAGWRDCGETTLPLATSLRLPRGMARLPDAERVAMLVPLLAREGNPAEAAGAPAQ